MLFPLSDNAESVELVTFIFEKNDEEVVAFACFCDFAVGFCDDFGVDLGRFSFVGFIAAKGLLLPVTGLAAEGLLLPVTGP